MQTHAWLNVEAKMSCDRCATCKYVGYCDTSKARVATECREYRSLDSALAFEWDLKDLMKLWITAEQRVPVE
jgi:hypothetical protein